MQALHELVVTYFLVMLLVSVSRVLSMLATARNYKKKRCNSGTLISFSPFV
jgi:hypothetical protein